MKLIRTFLGLKIGFPAHELSYFIKLFDPPQGFIIEKSGLD